MTLEQEVSRALATKGVVDERRFDELLRFACDTGMTLKEALVQQGVVTYGVVYRVETQIVKNAQAGALEFDWWRDMKEVTFLAGLILFVPALTSRFFGFAALGELSRAALGSNLDMAVGRTLLSLGSWRSAPHLSERSTLGDGSDRDDRRAGD